MLATIQDLIDITGQSYTDDQVWQLTTLLNIASRQIQKETGQKIERMSHVWLPRYQRKLKVPEFPNPVITSVKDVTGNSLNYFFDGYEYIWITNPALISFDFTPYLFALEYRLEVTYEAGYEIIPADIKAICCQMVLRAYGADPTKSGMTQESITNYSYQQGQAAAAGAIGMLPIEKDALSGYKRVRGPVSMRGTSSVY